MTPTEELLLAPRANGAGPRLVIVGAGHTHLTMIRDAHRISADGASVTLITPGPFWYTGMMPGLIGGRYTAAEISIDPKVILGAGATLLSDWVTAIDLTRKCVRLSGGGEVPFDILSLNVGSRVPLEAIPGAAEFALPVKPAGEFLAVVNTLRDATAGNLSLTVAGGGIAAVEMALNLKSLFIRSGRPHTITLATTRLMGRHPARAAGVMRDVLEARGIRLRLGSKIARIEQHRVVNENGDSWDCDRCVTAIGIKPPRLLFECGLAVDDDGSMIVNDRLQSVSHPFVFGGGDCVALRGQPLARVGVYAVREAPILCANVRSALFGQQLVEFRPQKYFLLIADLGDGRGLLLWRSWVVLARWVLWLKVWIDRRFMSQNRAPGLPGRSNRVITGARAAVVGVIGLIAGLYVTWEMSATWPRVDAMIRERFPTVPQMETARLQQQLDSGTPIVLIDVRTPPEFAVSHLAHARRADPFHDPDLAISRLPKNTPIVAYCSVGYRSSDYVQRLRSLGFTQAMNLKGSIFAWANEGRPLVNDHGTARKVHPFDARWGRLLLPVYRADP